MVQQTSNEAVIYGYVDTLIHNPYGDAALLGNLGWESDFDPTRPNPGEGAIGLAQWEGGRRIQLQRYAAAHGGKETDLRIQLGFLGQELTGPYRQVLTYLRGAKDVRAAAAYVDVGPGGPRSGTGFENSSGSATAQRQTLAATIYGQIQSGALTATSAPNIPSGGGSPAAGFGLPNIPGTPLSDLNKVSELLPWNWGKDISKATQGVVQTIIAFVTKALFVLAGLGLTLLGAYIAAKPEPAVAGGGTSG
jgi:hypothetical protein